MIKTRIEDSFTVSDQFVDILSAFPQDVVERILGRAFSLFVGNEINENIIISEEAIAQAISKNALRIAEKYRIIKIAVAKKQENYRKKRKEGIEK